jgi:hypothetical protein
VIVSMMSMTLGLVAAFVHRRKGEGR